MPKTLNLINKRFGKGLVISFAGHKYKGKTSQRQVRIWNLHCDCGKDYIAYTEALTSGDCSSCGCQRYVFHGNSHIKTTMNRYLKHLKQDAKRRGKAFLLAPEDLTKLMLKQRNRCALSGLAISFDNSSASLDRIDNSIDYQINNVQWVHRKVNYMKNILNQKEFIKICKLIANH